MTSGPALWRQSGYAFFRDVLLLDDGRSYGAALDDWQIDDFTAVFQHPERHVWWERPRGHSKTGDAAAVALHHILTGPRRRAYVGATDREQAALIADTVAGFISRSELLRDALDVQKWRIVARSTGSTLEVLPADAASSWGLRPSLVVIDEIEAWRGDNAERFFQSLYTALGKVPDARLIVCGTAGWDRNSLAWRLRQHVMTDPAWTFSRRGQCASWVNADFLEQQRRLLPDHVFRMLHLNEWTEAGGEFLTWAEIDAVFDVALQPLRRRPDEAGHVDRFIGIDLAVSRDRTAVALVRAIETGAVIVENIASWQGTPSERVELQEVEDSVAHLAETFSATVTLDPWQGLLLAERLRARGITVQEYPFTGPSRAKLFETLLQLIRQRQLKAFPHDLLREELTGLRWVEKGGILRPDHPVDGHDDVAIAVALAALAAVEKRIEPDFIGFAWVN